jgi:hypothetical protein
MLTDPPLWIKNTQEKNYTHTEHVQTFFFIILQMAQQHACFRSIYIVLFTLSNLEMI